MQVFKKLTPLILLVLLSSSLARPCADNCSPACPQYPASCPQANNQQQTCESSSCSTCCINNVCAGDSSNCGLSKGALVLIFIPVAVLVLISLLILCLRIMRNQQLIRRREELRAQQMNGLINIPEGQAASSMRRNPKIVPINTIEVLASTIDTRTGLTPVAPSAGFKVVEIDHKDFERQMMESMNGSCSPNLLRMKVSPIGTPILREVKIEDEDIEVAHLRLE